LALLATALLAQSGGIRGPVSGLVYDGAARAIRPVNGVPGAAYLGSPVVAEIDFASVSPDGDAALALSAGRLYLVRGLNEQAPRWSVLEDNSSAARAAWSADSDAAAVYSSASGAIRRYGSLKSVTLASDTRLSPRAGPRRVRPGVKGLPVAADIGVPPAGEISAMAIDSRGDVLAGIAGGVYLGSRVDGFRLVASVDETGGIALAGDRLFIADRARGQIIEVRDYAAAADVQLFAGADRGVTDPVALAVSPDGRSLIAASGAGRNLQWFDLETRASTARIDLDFEPSRLDPRNGGALFLLNSRGAAEEPLQVLAGRRNPAVYFVPAGAAEVAQETGVEE
jgi:hypothetical protein